MAAGVAQAGKALVGRASELEAVLRVLDESAEGVAGALLITGEAGVGKTALLQESTSRLPSSADVVWGSCLPLNTLSVPFLPLISALRRRSGDQGPVVDFNGSAANALTAFDGWLDKVCGQRPVVLVIDDLQWADQSSLDVLLYVLAGPADRSLTVLMAVRQGEEGPLLPEWLANVRRLPRTRQLRLRRLDRFGVQAQLTALLGQPPHASLVDQLYVKAAGNPYLTELLARGLNPVARNLPEGLPTDLHDAVARTWRRLTPNARALTSLLSVVGHPQNGERLVHLAKSVGVAGDQVSLLREAVDAGVVELRDHRYWFGHPLLAEVLVRELLPEERQRLHACCAQTLGAMIGGEAEPDADVAVALADHHAGAGNHQEAFRWALIAAAAAERSGGAAEELRLLRRALTLWPELPPPQVPEDELLRRLSSAADRCGDIDTAIEAVDRLLGLADAGADPLAVVDVLISRIELGYEAGKAAETASLDLTPWAVQLSATQPDSAQHAVAVALLAQDELWSGMPAGQGRAEEAVRLASTCGDTKAMALALTARATARTFAGEADALEDALAAEEVAATAGDFRTYLRATCAASNCIDIGPTNRAGIEHSARSRERLAAMAAPHRYLAWLSAQEAYSLLMAGDWRACVELIRVALGSTPGAGPDCVGRLAAALLDIRQGRWQQAEQHLARAVELPRAPYEFYGYHAIHAELEIARGDDRAAFDAAMAGVTVGRANLTEHLIPLATRALANEAQTLRDRGHDPEAVLRTLRDLQKRYPDVLYDVGPGPAHAAEITAMRAMYDAEAARAINRSDSAALWAGAAECSEEAGLAWDEAYAWWRAAEAGLHASTASRAARDHLRRAHRMATDLEAAPLLKEIQALAHQARIPLATTSALEQHSQTQIPSLTKREQEVLTLVVAGSTYAEIAADLFISEKTVSTHISHMLRKTNTSGRIELAQLARRLSTTVSLTTPPSPPLTHEP